MDSIKGPSSKTSGKFYTVSVNPTGPQVSGMSLGLGVAVEVIDTGAITDTYEIKEINGIYSSKNDDQLLLTDSLVAREGDVITITSGPLTGRQVIVLKNDGAGRLTISEELIESQSDTAAGTTFDVERPRYIRISDLGGGGGSMPSIDSIIQVTDGNVGTALEILKTGTPTQGELKTMVFDPANIAASDTGNDLLIALASTISTQHTWSTTQTFNGTVNSNGLQLNNVHVGGTLSFAAGFGTTLSAGSTRLNVTSGSGNVELMNQTGSSPSSSVGSRVTVMNNGGGTMTFVHGIPTSGTSFGFLLPGGNNLTLENNEGAIFERSREAGTTTWKLVGLGQIPSAGGASGEYTVIQDFPSAGPSILGNSYNYTIPASFTNPIDIWLVPKPNSAGFTGPSNMTFNDGSGSGVQVSPLAVSCNPDPVTGPPLHATQRSILVNGTTAVTLDSMIVCTIDPSQAGTGAVTIDFAPNGATTLTPNNFQLVAIER